ncbi:MAG: AmmeMemoRadiSam system protein A, partial [Synergistaceae bacterium]|nr:AmmeMemoRadiSam system protein A [Synergistaceae bacterium]
LKKQESPYVRLARETVERYVSSGKRIAVPEYLPEEALTRRAGTFVSLKKFGQLRGCIGTISATEENIAKEIIQNAISASTRDPRFPPVSSSELKDLVYSVDILGDSEDIDSPEDLDVKKYGVIVSKGYKKGLLLPNLEGIDTVEEQISIAMQKAGIREGEKIRLQRFEVVRHH